MNAKRWLVLVGWMAWMGCVGWVLAETGAGPHISLTDKVYFSALTGKVAPDFAFTLPDGTATRLSEQKGRVVMLALFTTVDVQEPNEEYADRFLVDLGGYANRYKDNPDMVFLMAAREAEREDVQARMERLNLSFPIAYLPAPLFGMYDGHSSLLAINNDGIVQGKTYGGYAGFQSFLDEWTTAMLAGVSFVEHVKGRKPKPWEFTRTLEPFSLCGRPAPDFEWPLLEGGTLRLSDYKGKVVVLDFWSDYSTPCQNGFSVMQSLNHYYAGRDDVAVVGVCLAPDTYAENAKSVLAGCDTSYPNVIADETWARTAYKARHLQSVLIGKEGHVIGRSSRHAMNVEDWVNTINDVLAGKRLPGDRPYSEKELEYAAYYFPDEIDCTANSNGHFFRKRQETIPIEQKSGKRMWHNNESMGSFLESDSTVHARGKTLTIGREGDTGGFQTVELPDEMLETSFEENGATWEYLKTANGDWAIGIQMNGTVKTGSDMLSLDGWWLWGISVGHDAPHWVRYFEYFSAPATLDVIQLSDEDGLIMVNCLFETLFFDAEGHFIFKIFSPCLEEAAWFDVDENGVPVLYSTAEGRPISVYDIAFPPKKWE